MPGEKRCASPSARKRAQPGSGRRGSRPAGVGGRATAAARRRSTRSPRSARVVRPGHAAAFGKQRRDDVGREVDGVDQRPADVAGDRADAHPRQGLAQAGLEGDDEVPDRGGRGDRLGAAGARELGRQLQGEPRMGGRGADREDHRHRMHVEDVRGVHDDVRAAAQPGIAQRGVDRARGQDRRHRQPVDRHRGVADEHDLHARLRGPHRGVGESAEGRGQPGGTRRGRPGRVERSDAAAAVVAARPSNPGRSATIGRSRRSVRGPRGGPPSSAGRRPSSTRRSITTRSRSGSMAGLVTWANAWRRWSATGRSRRPRPAVGVSSPMLHSGSCASSAIVLMSRRARSASRPAR